MPLALPLNETNLIRSDGTYSPRIVAAIAHARARTDMARVARMRLAGQWTFAGVALAQPTYASYLAIHLKRAWSIARQLRESRERSIAVAALSPVKREIWTLALSAALAESEIPPDRAKAERCRKLAAAISRDEAARVGLANFGRAA